MDKQEWHLIPNMTIKEWEKKKVKVAGKAICLLKLDGKLFAIGNRCPHAGADLSQGWCEGQKIVCPYHRHRFDLTTGKGDTGQGNFIPVYPTKIQDGQLYVGMEKPWWKTLF